MNQKFIHDPEAQLRAANRARSWNWAVKLAKSDISVWRLERFKTVTARADSVQLVLPEADQGRFSLMAWLKGVLAMAIAVPTWLVYLLFHRFGSGQDEWPTGVDRVAALHGELSTRTRHVLSALGEAEPPVEAIVLLGRVSQPRAKIAVLWSKTVPDVPLFLPMSPHAVLRAIGDLPRLISAGLAQSARTNVSVRLRDEVAMAFRVFLGAVAAHWWAKHDTACEVVFGITGTGDTVALECAIQRAGGRTVHAVHGQAIGPNFLGISDLALFRSRHDSHAYAKLGVYGACAVQEGHTSEPRRGETGLLLLSNLAHPMNPGFARFGLRDEASILKAVGDAARLLGVHAQPLHWKPHPVIADLPQDKADTLRRCAAFHGFEEVPIDMPIEQMAQRSRWVVTTPSTVALDLLQLGYLSIVLDPQGSVLDTTLTGLPGAICDPHQIAARCRDVDLEESYHQEWAAAVKMIGPARPLDLSVRLT